MKNIVDVAKARRAEFDALKVKAADADVLVSELEKVRDKLAKEAQDMQDALNVLGVTDDG